MVVASPIPGFKDAAAAGTGADDSDNPVETDLSADRADRGRVAEDQQVRRERVIIICVSEQGLEHNFNRNMYM